MFGIKCLEDIPLKTTPKGVYICDVDPVKYCLLRWLDLVSQYLDLWKDTGSVDVFVESQMKALLVDN